jgi:3-deoxy-7-phosphoheptulonate synthase
MATSPPAWSPVTWRERTALHQPEWPDPAAASAVTERLAGMPPLVFAGEARQLRESLAQVAAGRAFLLQAGDCAESFNDFSAISIREKLKIILQMAAVLTYGSMLPVVKLGRIAGQYTKPRSAATEMVDGVEVATFRGHMVHDDTPTSEGRRFDPERMVQGYHHAASTLNLLRAFTKGGFADLGEIHKWNLEFVRTSRQGRRYDALAAEIDRALRFMAACGIDLDAEVQLHQVDFYTSHEALLLWYEEALTRRDSLTNDWYDCSAHLLWIGERTRQLDGAHVEFLAGVQNPIAVKLGPDASADDAVALCRRLDPAKTPGRLTLVSRMGAQRVRASLPPLLRAVERAGHPVVWACDPMHGNTFQHDNGYKTRHFDEVMAELDGFFTACRTAGVWPGGVHIELTGDDVTECLGGAEEVLPEHLDQRYETACDPRLNARQSLELAFRVGELLRAG